MTEAPAGDDQQAVISFEEGFRRLEETTRQIERGDLPLNDLVRLFEEGTRLAALCNQLLDAAELRVSQLAPTADGSYEETPFPGVE